MDEFIAVAASIKDGFIAHPRVLKGLGYKKAILLSLAEKREFSHYCQMLKVNGGQIIEKINAMSEEEGEQLARDIYLHWQPEEEGGR
ncbi:hypothetical protein [Desulfofalx alkaliphila]|uniref:hypothetical protein n=1 Tax=Desulfofalx alkaliphila TaxID=105483 RepID=UPI00146F94A5|nr:hypothetical protein [Desulfofalx alkaliphila]